VADLDRRRLRRDDRLDGGVGQLVHQLHLPGRRAAHARVREAHGPHAVDQRRSGRREQRREQPPRLVGFAHVHGADREHALALGQVHQQHSRAQRVGRAGDPLAVAHERLGRALDGEACGAGVDLGDRMQAQLHRGDHPEAAATAAQRPEEVGVVVGGRGHDAPVGRDDLGAQQAVGREAVAASKPAEPAAEGVARHAHRGGGARQGREPEGRRGRQDIAPDGARADAGDPPVGVHEHGRHVRRPDEDGAVGRHVGAVSGGLHAQRQVVLARGDDRCPHVGGALRLDDHRGPRVDRVVQRPARRLVAGLAGQVQLARERAPQAPRGHVVGSRGGRHRGASLRGPAWC
jgi:hypothetical protein